MTYHGHVENGHVILDGAPGLPDGTPVVVTVVPTPVEPADGETPTLYERMTPIIGIADHLRPDASFKIDEVLYGRGNS